ncbi:MAG: hypothetical protein IT323_09365 [Anaerolineae bacterium]|nr:hypothetical protein [Anaerolineae bacterium]
MSAASLSPALSASRGMVWLRRGLLAAALALMLGHAVVYAVYAVSLASFPFDYDQGEGFELNDTVLLAQGEWPYRDNEAFPFYASNYPPLYHVVLIPFARLFGPEYWYGRLAGFAATLVTAWLIGHAVRRATRHTPVAALAGLAYLASNYVYHIGPLFRQHISMVMLETLAVVVIATLDDTPDRRARRLRIVAALVFLLAAGFTKQLAYATCAAVFAWLALRGVRRAIAWGVIFGAVGGAIFLWINVATQGQWWLNIITANVNQFIPGQYTGLLSQFVGLHGALLLLAALMLVYELYLDRLSVYSVWFAAALLNSVLAGKWGAGDSYFATAIAAMCILAGIFAGRSLNGLWRFPAALARRAPRGLGAAAGLAALALFALYGLAVVKAPLNGALVGPVAGALGLQSNTKFPTFYDSAGWTMGYATIGQIPTAEDAANGWRIVDLVDDDPRPILSEEAAFSFRSGKPVVSNPTQLLNLYNNDAYDPASLVAAIEAHEFGAVIFRARFYPPPVLDAVDRAYEIADVIPMNGYEYTVMLPDPDWAARRASQAGNP